jgi:Zn-dependent protease
MHDTVRVGRIAGVRVGLHWSLLVVGGLLTEQLDRGRFPADVPGYSSVEYLGAAVVTVVAFLGCVLAHELGHAVVARRAGVGVGGITLGFLGGVTRLTSETTTPRTELAVSCAGPLTNVVLGVILLGIGVGARAASVSPLVVAIVGWLGVINVVLALFNALPAAPLDGGRLLYAFAWIRYDDQRRATRIASRAGMMLGTVLAAVGVFELAVRGPVVRGLSLVLVGCFLGAAARPEPPLQAKDESARETRVVSPS